MREPYGTVMRCPQIGCPVMIDTADPYETMWCMNHDAVLVEYLDYCDI